MSTDRYTGRIDCAASCETVYRALSTMDGMRGWWTPQVSGNPQIGHELCFTFAGANELIRMRVAESEPSRRIRWTCLEHTGAREWTDSTVTFELMPGRDGRCTLALEHVGVPPALVDAGWHHFLMSIADYASTGRGRPYRAS